MKERLVVDTETDALLRNLKIMWCLVLLNIDTKEATRYVGEDEIREHALPRMAAAGLLIGHNLLNFDVPAIEKCFGVTIDRYDESGAFRIFDTLIMSRLLCGERVLTCGAKPHSLKAWGETLGVPKTEFHDFSHYCEEMVEYCEQDCFVCLAIYDFLFPLAVQFNAAAELENQIADVTAEQERNGFQLDVPAARELAATLRAEFEATRDELIRKFPPKILHQTAAGWEGEDGGLPVYTTPKTSNKRTGITAGCPYAKIKIKALNPTSRTQVGKLFVDSFNWKPLEKTPTGKPKVSETILRNMIWPEAQQFADIFGLQKRIAMIDGDGGWLSFADENGRVFGEANTLGTITGRFTHKAPNISQADKKDFRMRKCWISGDGKVLVGADVKSLELCMLSQYTLPFDGGALARIIETTDPHEVNAAILGFTSKDARKLAKRMIYAYVYGAGNAKIGSIVRNDAFLVGRILTESDDELGRVARAKLQAGIKGLREVTDEAMEEAASGTITALDGRKIRVRKDYSALNFRLQSAGAIVMKKAMIIWRQRISEAHLDNVALLVAQIHDEAVVECVPEYADQVAELLRTSVVAAGQFFKLAVNLEANSQIGKCWGDIH